MDTDNNRNVLSVGADAELIWLRNAVLRSAGFKVVSTLDVNEALARIEAGDCGVLLVCYSLSRETIEELATRFRESCRDGRVVAVANENWDKPTFADTYVYGIEGPEALIDAIRGAKGQRGAPD
jgi:DNA-binding NtrC family response regulator